MLKNTLLLLAFMLPIIFVATSCGDDEDPQTCDTSNVTYTNSVASILNTNCALSGCHNSGSAVGSLANYTDAVFFASFGSISGAINHDSGFSPMPFPQGSDKMADCDIDKIDAWLAAGTPE